MRSRWGWLRPGHLGSEADRATFRTMHTASLAGPPLRSGLTEAAAGKAIRHLHDLLGTPAVALTDTQRLLAWEGKAGHHAEQAASLALPVVAGGSTVVGDKDDIPCYDPVCPLRHVIVSPLTVEDRVVGTLQVFAPNASAGLVRATNEVARWVSTQLELA
ncbi:MAG TPA: sensor histidine kinase, partial [Nocardioidaceae bacterium]